MIDATVRPCAVEGCGKMLKTWEQFGPDYLKPMCREHWQAHQHNGQMVLPEERAPELWDAAESKEE